MKLTDGQVAEIRALAGENVTSTELAATFGVTRRQIERIVRGDQRRVVEGADERPVLESLNEFFDSADIDGPEGVVVETARALAGKIDACSASDSAGAAAAMPALAREQGSLLEKFSSRLREPDGIDAIRARVILRRAGYEVDDSEGDGPGTAVRRW